MRSVWDEVQAGAVDRAWCRVRGRVLSPVRDQVWVRVQGRVWDRVWWLVGGRVDIRVGNMYSVRNEWKERGE